MSLNFDDDETDRLLEEVNDEALGIIEESQPRPSPGSSDAVHVPAIDAIIGTQGMALGYSSGGELRRGEGLCQGSPPGISTTHKLLLSSLPLYLLHIICIQETPPHRPFPP